MKNNNIIVIVLLIAILVIVVKILNGINPKPKSVPVNKTPAIDLEDEIQEATEIKEESKEGVVSENDELSQIFDKIIKDYKNENNIPIAQSMDSDQVEVMMKAFASQFDWTSNEQKMFFEYADKKEAELSQDPDVVADEVDQPVVVKKTPAKKSSKKKSKKAKKYSPLYFNLPNCIIEKALEKKDLKKNYISNFGPIPDLNFSSLLNNAIKYDLIRRQEIAGNRYLYALPEMFDGEKVKEEYLPTKN